MSAPQTTKAVRIFEHGSPDVMTYGEYPLDPVGPRSVAVRVVAASVSRWDVLYREGLPEELHHPGRKLYPLPQQLGREAAGVVIEVGAEVTEFQVGDHVVGATHPEDPMSIESARALGNLSPNVELPGHQGLGGYAEFLVRDKEMWFKLDKKVDLEQAALTLWPYSTSHRIVRDRLGVHLGDVVLVLGGSGGMGSATVQLAALMGARVVATTRNKAKAAGLRAMGADVVLVLEDYDTAAAELREYTNGAGVEHVVDYVCDDELTRFALGNTRLGGKYCVTSADLQSPGLAVNAADFIRLELSMLGVRGARRADSIVALDLLSRGAIHTPIAARFALADAAEAHRFLDQNHAEVGRVLLTP